MAASLTSQCGLSYLSLGIAQAVTNLALLCSSYQVAPDVYRPQVNLAYMGDSPKGPQKQHA